MHNYCIAYPFFKTHPDFHPVADMSPRCCRRCLRSQAAKAIRKRDVLAIPIAFLDPPQKKPQLPWGWYIPEKR